MPVYLTKPTKKEAEQFWSDGRAPLPFQSECACCFDGTRWYVVTTHGQETTIVDGDYIIREPDGNGFYPCKPQIFETNHVLMEQM